MGVRLQGLPNKDWGAFEGWVLLGATLLLCEKQWEGKHREDSQQPRRELIYLPKGLDTGNKTS